jgi:putative membrane protein
MSTAALAAELGVVVLVYGWLTARRATTGRPAQPHGDDRVGNQAGGSGVDSSGSTAIWSFLAGIAAVAAALVSPLHQLAERSLAGHMVQHLILISVAAPLLAAAAVQVATLLVWHLPPLFDLAVRRPLAHEAEHAALLATAFALWFVALRLRPGVRGGAVLALFVASLPPMAYGVALTLARTPWYPAYRAEGIGSQQLAGVVMWAYGGLAALAGGVAVGVEWLRSAERASPEPRTSSELGTSPEARTEQLTAIAVPAGQRGAG